MKLIKKRREREMAEIEDAESSEDGDADKEKKMPIAPEKFGRTKAIIKKLDNIPYYTKRVKNGAKKRINNFFDDIAGTNIFSKYESVKAKIEPILLLSGSGYKSFRTLSLWCLVICPSLIFIMPKLYMFYAGQYIFDVVRCSPRAKLKDNYPLSHRQKRKKVEEAMRKAAKNERLRKRLKKAKNKMKMKFYSEKKRSRGVSPVAKLDDSGALFHGALC